MEFDAARLSASGGPAFVKLLDHRVIMSETTTTRPIKYWNGRTTKRWNGQLPLRMTAEQIEGMAQSWPEFSEKLQDFAGKQINGKIYEPWIYSHGAVVWLLTASA